jgi:hypothetical protein
VLHEATQGKIVLDLLQRRETLREKMIQETRRHKLGLIEQERTDPGDAHQNSTNKICVDFPALPDGFAELGFLLASSYPIVTKSSTVCKNQRTG